MKRTTLYAAGAAALIVAGGVLVFAGSDEEAVTYRFAVVERGDIVSAISTSGTLGALVTVEVGSQVSGQVAELHADYNTAVSEGQLIARIDPRTFESLVRQAEAELAIARAGLAVQRAAHVRATADVASAAASLRVAGANAEDALATKAEADRELQTKSDLVSRGVAATRDLDRARADADGAAAKVRAAQAQIAVQTAGLQAVKAAAMMAAAQVENAQAQVQHRNAALDKARVDLDRTAIRAPVDGVVIDREVSLGQTVAASLNAPVLFTIAQDLRQMQVEASVDEADIGRVRPGQPVKFTVDAYPGRSFGGRVEQVRQKPQVVQNVVTYTVIVSAANPDLALLPGMTANVEVVLERRADALKVPNAALRFRPASERSPAGGEAAQVAVAAAPAGSGGPLGALSALDLDDGQRRQVQALTSELRERARSLRAEGVPASEIRETLRGERGQLVERLRSILTTDQFARFEAANAARRGGEGVSSGRVWTVQGDGAPVAVAIRYGATDGSHTEIVSGELAAGQRIIVGASRPPAQRRGLPAFRF